MLRSKSWVRVMLIGPGARRHLWPWIFGSVEWMNFWGPEKTHILRVLKISCSLEDAGFLVHFLSNHFIFCQHLFWLGKVSWSFYFFFVFWLWGWGCVQPPENWNLPLLNVAPPFSPRFFPEDSLVIFPMKKSRGIFGRSAPGDSMWPFHPLVGGHLTIWKGHLTIPKRSPWITWQVTFGLNLEDLRSSDRSAWNEGTFEVPKGLGPSSVPHPVGNRLPIEEHKEFGTCDLGGSNSKIFYFHPGFLGKMIQFDEHIFEMGWFNHQPVLHWSWQLFFVFNNTDRMDGKCKLKTTCQMVMSIKTKGFLWGSDLDCLERQKEKFNMCLLAMVFLW